LLDGAWSAGDNARTKQVIELTGIWGAHSDYRFAWKPSGETVEDNPLTANAVTVTVSDSTPFQVGQLLRIGTEFALVEAITITPGVDPAPDVYTLTVERAANGSTAAQHAQDTDIYIWQVQGNIVQAAARLVKWRYTQKDVDTFDRTYFGETGQVVIPTALPADVISLLGAKGKARI
jgi:hypothetical protein